VKKKGSSKKKTKGRRKTIDHNRREGLWSEKRKRQKQKKRTGDKMAVKERKKRKTGQRHLVHRPDNKKKKRCKGEEPRSTEPCLENTGSREDPAQARAHKWPLSPKMTGQRKEVLKSSRNPNFGKKGNADAQKCSDESSSTPRGGTLDEGVRRKRNDFGRQ